MQVESQVKIWPWLQMAMSSTNLQRFVTKSMLESNFYAVLLDRLGILVAVESSTNNRVYVQPSLVLSTYLNRTKTLHLMLLPFLRIYRQYLFCWSNAQLNRESTASGIADTWKVRFFPNLTQTFDPAVSDKLCIFLHQLMLSNTTYFLLQRIRLQTAYLKLCKEKCSSSTISFAKSQMHGWTFLPSALHAAGCNHTAARLVQKDHVARERRVSGTGAPTMWKCINTYTDILCCSHWKQGERKTLRERKSWRDRQRVLKKKEDTATVLFLLHLSVLSLSLASSFRQHSLEKLVDSLRMKWPWRTSTYLPRFTYTDLTIHFYLPLHQAGAAVTEDPSLPFQM